MNKAYNFGFQDEMNKLGFKTPSVSAFKEWANATGKIPLWKPPAIPHSKAISSATSRATTMVSSAGGFAKTANIPIGDDKELDTGRLGSYVLAPMMATATGKSIYKDLPKILASKTKGSKIPRIQVLKRLFKNQNLRYGKLKAKILAPVIIGGAIAGGVSIPIGSSIGRAAEKYLIRDKKITKGVVL